VIVTPGQDTALTIRNTLLAGRRGGVWTAAGVVTGQLAWATATSAGLAALLIASQPVFTALKLAGAAYLIWLGAAALVSAVHGRSTGSHTGGLSLRGRTAYRQGVLSNLGNPKMAVFFTSLLPQFGSSFLVLVGHSLLFSSLTLLWLALVVRAGDLLRVPTVRRAVDVATGVVLVAFGLRLATERR
jgi:threonine/homoserine/homoserine lactone efflux protein